MSCTPHPQVISPCADDGVSVGQALGTTGDISYDEAGSVALTVNQTTVAVDFSFTKESLDYVFEYLYIKTGDDNPIDIRPVPKTQTKRGFVVELTGTPITANSMLFWRVVVPDPLRTCDGLNAAVQYADVKPAQEGIAAMTQDVDFVEVLFPIEQPDGLWKFESLTFEFHELIDAPYLVMVFVPICTVHTKAGFRLELSGSPDRAGYALHWRIRAL